MISRGDRGVAGLYLYLFGIVAGRNAKDEKRPRTYNGGMITVTQAGANTPVSATPSSLFSMTIYWRQKSSTWRNLL
jgi:hypothetical protein